MSQSISSFWPIWLLLTLTLLYRIFEPKTKGYLGEKAIAGILSQLEPEKYTVINDVMLSVGGKTSQMDHIVVSDYGIFVIETKNYKGWILGDERNGQWTQVIYKKKHRFLNPIIQNKGHIKALQHHLSEYPDARYTSIIVFSPAADLKVTTETPVVYATQLLQTIRSYADVNLDAAAKAGISIKLGGLNIQDTDARKQHVIDIHGKKQRSTAPSDSSSCPRCGGKLVKRNGKTEHLWAAGIIRGAGIPTNHASMRLKKSMNPLEGIYLFPLCARQ